MAKEIRFIDYENDRVECNLCHRRMKIEEYDSHYGKCFDVEYLVNTARAKGKDITREDIENCRQEVIEKLMKKYPPEEFV